MTATRKGRVEFEAHQESSIELPIPDHQLTLGNSLLWSVGRHGAQPAMVFGDRRWSYEELASDVEQCARALIACGVTKGSRVGLLLGARAEFVIAAYATAMVGGVAVFLNTFSRGEELEWTLRHSDTSLLIAHELVRDRQVRLPRAGGASLPFLGRVVPIGEWDGFLKLGDDCDPEYRRSAMQSDCPDRRRVTALHLGLDVDAKSRSPHAPVTGHAGISYGRLHGHWSPGSNLHQFPIVLDGGMADGRCRAFGRGRVHGLAGSV